MKASFVLARRFYELSWVGRIRVAQDLGLRGENDAELKEFEADRVVFERARTRGLIAELWDRIQAEHGDGKYAVNPYRSPRGQEGGEVEPKICTLRERADGLAAAADDYLPAPALVDPRGPGRFAVAERALIEAIPVLALGIARLDERVGELEKAVAALTRVSVGPI